MITPKIRFPGYNSHWKECQIKDVVTENLDPVATPKEGYRRVGIYCHAKGTFQEDVPADKVLDVDKMYRIHKDNLIVNITFAWEHAIAIVRPEDEGLLVSHRFPEYKFEEGQSPDFYKYYILRPYMKQQLYLASPGGAGRNRVLNKNSFLKIPISIPEEEEQKKIAEFLSSVDELIATSEEEVANLEQQKKAAMQAIFSQQVRFKKEDGSDFPEWEETTIGQSCTVNPKTEKPGERFLYIDLGCVSKGLLTERNMITRSEAPSRAQRVLSVDDVLFQSVRPYNMGHYHFYGDNVQVVASTGFVQLRMKDGLNSFLYHYLFSPNFNRVVDKLCEGSNYPAISGGELSKIGIRIPHKDEQKLIADFLTSFDEAIAAAREELEKYKELKKGLLQQMFV